MRGHPAFPTPSEGGTGSNGPDALRCGVVNACLDHGSPEGGNNPGFFFAPPSKVLPGDDGLGKRVPDRDRRLASLASIGESRQNA